MMNKVLKSWYTNPRGSLDSKRKGKIYKGQVNDTKFDYDKKGLTSAIEYATKLMREKRPVNFKWHDDDYKKSHHDKSMRKEGDGGGFGDGGGTVVTSSDTGFFTPTYGGNGRRRGKRKRSGLDRMADFLTDNSPERKMVTKSMVANFTNWVNKEYKTNSTVFSSGDSINPQPPRIRWHKRSDEEYTDGIDNVVEFDAEPDDTVVTEQNDMENKIKRLDNKNDIKSNDAPEQGDASQAAPAGLPVQLTDWGSGPEKGPLVTGGYKDKKKGRVAELEDEAKERPFK